MDPVFQESLRLIAPSVKTDRCFFRRVPIRFGFLRDCGGFHFLGKRKRYKEGRVYYAWLHHLYSKSCSCRSEDGLMYG